MDLFDRWRVGFEIEVVLGDLGNDAWSDEPMDMATPGYCREVANQLRELTGRKWTAPLKKPKKTGYYVVPEYDLDPTFFEYGHQIAGVELITPPLPMDQAEQLRHDIIDALHEIDPDGLDILTGSANGMGWHINIDADANGRPMDPYAFAIGMDEIRPLVNSDRLGLSITTPQRHGFGVPLLKEMSVPGHGLSPRNMRAQVCQGLGRSKAYAANFARLDYVELRHYGLWEFLEGDTLESILDLPTRTLTMGFGATRICEDYQFARFEVLLAWLEKYRDEIGIEHVGGAFIETEFNRLTFSDETCGNAFWSGLFDISFLEADLKTTFTEIIDIPGSSLTDSVALLCLDVVDVLELGGQVDIASPALMAAIEDMRQMMTKSGLGVRPAIEDWNQ
ncbi:MAG: hypothetical protein ABJN42_00620 [Roseibium sp.]|uniref:hypothetical protein n=1 Tax=Roseibium sp. TaxID=1936156 RepID=UPI00329A5977